MTYAFFIGCKIPFYVPHYETAARTVCGELGIGLKDIEFNCCGYPMRHLDFVSALLAAARNLALAEKESLDLVTPCKCCFGSFRHAIHDLKDDPALMKTINSKLAEEGLSYKGQARVRHLLQVLHEEIGVDKLKERVTKPFYGLKAALIYGCHALRPSNITRFDDPLSPTLFDDLVKATGATSLDWEGKLQCCGGPLIQKNEDLSLSLALGRLGEAKAAGADYLTIGCTYTQMQMEKGLAELKGSAGTGSLKGSLVYPQLLGLALGSPRRGWGWPIRTWTWPPWPSSRSRPRNRKRSPRKRRRRSRRRNRPRPPKRRPVRIRRNRINLSGDYPGL